MQDEPKEPYVYQPMGQQDKEHWAQGRIFGVGTSSWLTTIKGLTREEATAVAEALARVQHKDANIAAMLGMK